MSLERLQKIDWKGKLGTELSVTARIAEFLSDVPGAGIIKAAASHGAELLDPPVSLDEIKALQEVLRGQRDELAKSLLSQQIEDMQKKYDNPKPEVRTDFQNIKGEMMEGWRKIKRDNIASLSHLSDKTQQIKQVFGIVSQLNYKVSF